MMLIYHQHVSTRWMWLTITTAAIALLLVTHICCCDGSKGVSSSVSSSSFIKDANIHRDDSSRQLNPSILSNVRLLILLVQFSDHTSDNRELPPKSHFESLCTNQIIPYLQQQSYQLYTISSCDVYDWLMTDNSESYYSYQNGNLVGSDLASSMFLPVLRQHDNSGSIDFSQYDNDLDLTIDALLIIHSGYASEQGDGSTTCGTNTPQNRIVSQGHVSSNPSVWTSNNGLYNIGGYAIASAYDRVCPGTATWATHSVMTHEFIHTFNTPDLYDLSSRSAGTSQYVGGIASYDIMSNPYGPNMDGQPSSMSSFTKELSGWISPNPIEFDGTYTISNYHDSGQVYKISKGYAGGGNEYLLIENRQNTGADSGLPGNGLLIYHVDLNVPLQDKSGFPGQSGWPNNGNHYRCALLQSDGKYDLEQRLNNGDSTDYWNSGMTLGPGNGNTVYPNTDSYQNGNIYSTGVTITDISASGASMTFRVSGLGSNPDGSGGGGTAPVTSPPVSMPPVTNPPQTSPPVTMPPVTNPPQTSPPVTSPPVTMPPVTIPPTTLPPVTTTTIVPTPGGAVSIVTPTPSLISSSNGTDDDGVEDDGVSYAPSYTPSTVPTTNRNNSSSQNGSIQPTFFAAEFNTGITTSSGTASLTSALSTLILTAVVVLTTTTMMMM